MQTAHLAPVVNVGGFVGHRKSCSVPLRPLGRTVGGLHWLSHTRKLTRSLTITQNCRHRVPSPRKRSQLAGLPNLAESLRTYYTDTDIDHFDSSVWQQLLQQDVLDILPCDVNLDPRGAGSQDELSILGWLATLPESSLSEVWSRSAKLTSHSVEIASRRPLADTVGPNQLAKQCSVFCTVVGSEALDFEDHSLSLADTYIIATLCHQVNVHDQDAFHWLLLRPCVAAACVQL